MSEPLRDTGLPPLTMDLIARLDEEFPVKLPSSDDLSNEKGRLDYQKEVGWRDCIDYLKKLRDA